MGQLLMHAGQPARACWRSLKRRGGLYSVQQNPTGERPRCSGSSAWSAGECALVSIIWPHDGRSLSCHWISGHVGSFDAECRLSVDRSTTQWLSRYRIALTQSAFDCDSCGILLSKRSASTGIGRISQLWGKRRIRTTFFADTT